MKRDTDNLAELMEAALGAIEDGIAILDEKSHVVAWNSAATAISGYNGNELRARTLPDKFYQIDAHHHSSQSSSNNSDEPPTARAVLVNLRHCEGHSLPAMLRQIPLRNALGRRFGTMLRFHPADEIDALPLSEIDLDGDLRTQVEESLAAMQDRLDLAWQEWTNNAIPFGLIRLTVDQAPTLRKTHGREACEAMFRILERTLVHSLRPSETLCRWANNEFLVLSHERTVKLLEAHASHLAESSKSSDFRWWGDRVSLTVSLSVAQAENATNLRDLLISVQKGMQTSLIASGNHLTYMGGQECSQS